MLDQRVSFPFHGFRTQLSCGVAPFVEDQAAHVVAMLARPIFALARSMPTVRMNRPMRCSHGNIRVK